MCDSELNVFVCVLTTWCQRGNKVHLLFTQFETIKQTTYHTTMQKNPTLVRFQNGLRIFKCLSKTDCDFTVKSC